jgi:hypothetical protein
MTATMVGGRRRDAFGKAYRLGEEFLAAAGRTEEPPPTLMLGSMPRRRRVDGHAADRIDGARWGARRGGGVGYFIHRKSYKPDASMFHIVLAIYTLGGYSVNP